MTSGAHNNNPESDVNVGIATHILAVLPGGPRFDPSKPDEELHSIENLIWLCQGCSWIIDSRPAIHSSDLLKEWKAHAEQIAIKLLNPDGVPLLFQAVVISGNRTPEGRLVEAVTFPWFAIIESLGRNPALAFQIDSRKWEEIIAGAYKTAGFEEVTLTPRSGDFGRDVIAVKRGIGTIRVIDQVKAYKPGHLVTANDVRALLGVLEGDKASKGFLTTTSDFAPKLSEDILLKPFMPSRLELITGKVLLDRLAALAAKKA